MKNLDFIVVGAGMSGASVAYELSALGQVLVLEKEDIPGRHSTGRSSALFDESYGKEAVRKMSVASRDFLLNPPKGFCEHDLLSPRPMMVIGTDAQSQSVDRFYEEVQPLLGNLERLAIDAIFQKVPQLKECITQAVLSPGCMDMDVAAQHQGYLKAMKHRGGILELDCHIQEIRYRQNQWQLKTSKGDFQTPVIVNAAGAWADQIAKQAGVKRLGLKPLQRTVTLLEADKLPGLNDWPMVMDADEQFYFKPDSGAILLTPADEAPVTAGDVQPEELDIAIAIDRLEKVLDIDIKRIRHSWAGLRVFAPDRVMVIGEDTQHQGFFWLAGQGGYGIMTAPANAQLCQALITGQSLPNHFEQLKINPEVYSPQRF